MDPKAYHIDTNILASLLRKNDYAVMYKMTTHNIELRIITHILKYIEIEPGCWHNGSVFVFCPGDCLFESEPSPTNAHASGEVTGCVPATKRLAHEAPQVDLGECTLHSPPQKIEKYIKISRLDMDLLNINF